MDTYRFMIVPALLVSLTLHAAPSVPAASPPPDEQHLEQLTREAALRHQVPPEALQAVTLAESGRLIGGRFRPWPWTLNVGGRGYYYNSREEACRALTRFMRVRSLKRIDAGLAQTNLGWHGHRFVTSCDALDPSRNLDAAARILRDCYQTRNGSWLDAAACYHHPRGGLQARRYRATVQKHLTRLVAQSATPVLLVDIPEKHTGIPQ